MNTRTSSRNETVDLTKGSLTRHLARLAIPASTGFLFSTFYNLIDTFWAGRLSTESLAALSLNFTLYMLAMSIGIGFSSASGALISNSIGEQKPDRAKMFLNQTLGLSFLSSLAVAILLLLTMAPIFRLLNAQGTLLTRSVNYARIILLGMPLINLGPVLSSALSARGDNNSYRNTQIAGTLLNIGLDPLFMFTLGMEEAGLALATVLIQILTTTYLFVRIKKLDGISPGIPQSCIPKKSYTPEITAQAVPATLNFLTMSFGGFIITWFISRYGSTVVAAYGSALRIEQIALLPTVGLNIGLASLVGQNNGARLMVRVKQSYIISLVAGLILMGIILPPVLIFGRSILGLLTPDTEVIRIGYSYLLFQGLTYYSYIVLFQSNALLQGLKKPAMIMWMGLYRQIVTPVIVFSLLSIVMGMKERGVWIGLIFINWSAALITLAWALSLLRKRVRHCQLEPREAPEDAAPATGQDIS